MKKLLYTFLVSLFGGFLALFMHNFYYDHSNNIITEEKDNMVNISFNPLSNSNLSVENDFVSAAEKTIHSVVHVKNTSISGGNSSLWDYFNNSGGKTRVGMGSGVIISEDGYIITNNHVIENASTIEITTNNNKTYNAELLGSDEVSDIAVLKIVGDESFPYIRFADSDQTKIGEWVLAVGNPFNLTSTVTAGIISAKSRDLNDFDSIGINTAITSGTGGFVGYSFAVPSNVARKIFEDIIEFGNVQKGLLGVTGFGLNSKSANELNIDLTEGFFVNDTEAEMGAERAGIIKGDVIISLDNIKIEKFSDLSGYLSTKRPGDKISVGIIRDNKNIKLRVTLEKNNNVSFLGMQLKNMTKTELESYKITHGLKISNLRNSSLFRMGVKPGYALTEINNNEIKKTEDLSNYNSNTKINQMIFVSPNGEKERLIFE